MLICALLLAALFIIGKYYPAPLYSPGDVVESHGDLRCNECHVPFTRILPESCSAAKCHEAGDTGSEPSVKELHGTLQGDDCLGCHTDHKGSSAEITTPFDHTSSAGEYGCIDCHRTVSANAHRSRYSEECTSCHTVRRWDDITFNHDMVTEKQCFNCHNGPEDELHLAEEGDCASCHETKAWKPATYDHLVYFPLTRVHETGCVKCHDDRSYKKYTCMNCHEHATRSIAREHRGEGIRNYGDCLRCHMVRMEGKSYGKRRRRDSQKNSRELIHRTKPYKESEYEIKRRKTRRTIGDEGDD